MSVIIKYRFDLTEKINQIEMKKDGKIISVQNQQDCVCFWVLCSDNVETEIREFIAYSTGEEINNVSKLQFIETLLLNNGLYVIHIFEVIK